jgi:esterase/lipase superfamily enzyme
MYRDSVSWCSPRLNRNMELPVFGHAGTPILAFPSSGGRFHEWEDFGMVEALAPKLEGGQNHLLCVDSVDRESFYNDHIHPWGRILRHQQYEEYILKEVLPFIHNRTGRDFIIAAGAGFGSYHARNFTCKQPWAFGKLIALSGAFDIRSFLDGYYDDDVYFSNPVDYLPGLNDEGTLQALRDTRVPSLALTWRARGRTTGGVSERGSPGRTSRRSFFPRPAIDTPNRRPRAS